MHNTMYLLLSGEPGIKNYAGIIRKVISGKR